jgi:uncharacterized membrane protein YkoI
MLRLVTKVALTAVLSLAANASEYFYKEEQPGLGKRARITCDAARAAALKHAGKGRVIKSELEAEGDRLVFAFDIDDGAPLLLEVQVDAQTGQVVGQKREAREEQQAR